MSQLTICPIILAVTIIGYCSGFIQPGKPLQSHIADGVYFNRMSDGERCASACFSNGNVIMIAGM